MFFTAPHRDPKRNPRRTGAGARGRTAAAFALTGTALLVAAAAIAPVAAPSGAATLRATRVDGQQALPSAETVAAIAPRDGFDAELSPADMVQELIGDGTQFDWARLVLYDGGCQITDQKLLAITQWMRAENSPQSWWLRDNPLNNGYGTLAGNFMSGYPDLAVAAQQCAEAIQTRYPGIRAALAADSSRDDIRAAIIASSWATGHYGGGAHWGDATPPAVAAPASAWGQ